MIQGNTRELLKTMSLTWDRGKLHTQYNPTSANNRKNTGRKIILQGWNKIH